MREIRTTTAIALALAVALASGCGGGDGGSSGQGGAQSESGQRSGSGGSRDVPTAGSQPPVPSRPSSANSFVAARPTPAQRSQLAVKGRTTLRVQVGGPGEVTAFGQARIGGTTRKAATAPPRTAPGAGLVRLPLRLTAAARRRLAAGRALTVYVGVFFSRTRRGQRLAVRLEP